MPVNCVAYPFGRKPAERETIRAIVGTGTLRYFRFRRAGWR